MEEEHDVNETSMVMFLLWKFLYFFYYSNLYVMVPIWILLAVSFFVEAMMNKIMKKKKKKRETPSDEVLLETHNKLCSSAENAEETKSILEEYPEVLSHKVTEWGGSNMLHTVCSRQPNNFPLIKLLVAEGLKHNVGGAPHARGGLVVRDYFDRTPLNLLVQNNAISTLRQLMQCDPPLVVPFDVLDSRLFNSVESTYHVDMFRFLVHLNPETIANEHIILENKLLMEYMIDRVSDRKFLLRILPIMIKEGISQKVGGEYAIGGLFEVRRRRICSADMLLGQRRLPWTLLGPIISGAIDPANNNGTTSPILHGAILMRLDREYAFDHVKGICQNIKNAASIRDSEGRMAIHVGAAIGLGWGDKNGGMSDIVKANVLATKTRDPLTGLPVHALAAVGTYSLSSIYNLILLGGLEDFS